MSELISGKEAKLAWANGEKLKYITPQGWIEVNEKTEAWVFDSYNFDVIPRTITIDGVEVPAPFKPKEGEKYYYLKTGSAWGFACGEWGDDSMQKHYVQFGAWRTEEEVKQVLEALRSIFK